MRKFFLFYFLGLIYIHSQTYRVTNRDIFSENYGKSTTIQVEEEWKGQQIEDILDYKSIGNAQSSNIYGDAANAFNKSYEAASKAARAAEGAASQREAAKAEARIDEELSVLSGLRDVQ